MKRLLIILSAIFSFAGMQAQALKTGDVVSISFKNTPWNTFDYYTYMEASTSGILSKTYATDDCLWELTVNNNQYAFRDLTTGKYLAIHNTGSNQESLILSNQATLFSFTDKGSVEGKYMYGQLYYNTVTHWGAAVSLMVSEYGGTFLVAGWNAYDLYIEKWEQKGAGQPTGHFSPSKIEFTYAADEDAAAKQARDVTFMIEASTESYYQCVPRQDEALLRRSTGNVDENQIQIQGIYWESDSINKGLVSNLDVRKYVVHADVSRTLMTLSDPVTPTATRQWQFIITPVGKSPMGLKDKLGTQTRWIDYADNVVVEYTYGGGAPQKARMRVVRKAYHEEDLPTLVFSINPATYTFTQEAESKVFDVVATHQHGRAIFNVDSQIVDTAFTLRPEKIALTNANLALTDDTDWLTAERYGDYKIRVTATENNTNTKRSATLTGTLHPQQGGDHSSVSFTIPLYQRGEHGGIQFEPNMGAGNTGFEKNPHDNRNQQKVHTAERTIYYLPNQEIELRLPEAGFSGYMRWYDYETNGDPYYNENPADSTDWIRSPRAADGTPFFAINTPKDASADSHTADGISYGLYALNKDKDNDGSDVAIGGILNEDNTNNQAPILKGWDYTTSADAYHTIACDVSAYTDYEVNVTSGKIVSITEPTLSYRQLFHLRPAEEMADTLKARSERGVYLEEYKYQAPAGKQILLATQYRYKKARSHSSEMCYFFKDNWGILRSIHSDVPVQWYVQTKNADGILQDDKTEIVSPSYSAEMDYLIVRSDDYPVTKVYTLEFPKSSSWMDGSYTTDLLIARFEVEFVDIEKQGPTNKTIITQQRINTQYKHLAEINFDNINSHLPWEQASYGYVYTEGNLANQYKRGAGQGAFPFYGEYIVTESVSKDWARASAHGSKGKALYVDGTMEPGLVASITAPAKICSGQTMYCSAWLCNPAPSGWSGEGNPIFRCNIQGKNTDEAEWHDAGVYFAGELLKGTGWQQIVFPIQSAASYDSTRVSIYNFATTNQGNDFMVDDITLYVSQLPIAAYQGKMACRSTGDATTSAAAILRLDYSNIHVGSDGYMYYQIYNESYENKDANNDVISTGAPVNLTGEAAYYHDYDIDHGDENHNHPYGSVHIPEANFNPELENINIKYANNFLPESEKKDTFLIYQSVSKMLDEMADKGVKHAKAYIKTSNSGAIKWLLYVAHLVENVTESQVSSDSDLPLQKLYDKHAYSMRMAYSHEELSIPACNMQTPLHATQQTVFHLRNSDGEKIKHQKTNQTLVATKTNQDGLVENIFNLSTQNCANDLYFLTAKVVNSLAFEVGGSVQNIEAPICADWLVGEEFDDVYNTGRPATGSDEKIQADAAFLKKYGYTRGQVASAIMYDMRRIPTEDEPNPNYTARSVKELQPSAFQSFQNYEIVKHLCDSGWLQLYDTTTHFYLSSEGKARYWCFPIEGTSTTTIDEKKVTLKDCNEPKWVSISAAHSDYGMNIAPIENEDKTNQQKTQLPTVKVLAGSESVTLPITEKGETTQVEGAADGKITVNLTSNQLTFMNMETGRVMDRPQELLAGEEYTVRMTLKEDHGYEYPGNTIEGNCRVGYVFYHLQVVPNTLVWTPDGTTFTGWGLNDNWKGLIYDANGNITDTVEGFVPISGADVIIPKLDNPLAYPYIVHEGDTEHGHKHNHYPMTIGFEPHSCGNIYFAPSALLHNQHVLHYDKAFVDMQITAGGWNMMSAPLQGMVSGDMFIPHNGWYSENQNNLIAEPNPFEVKAFEGEGYKGIRHADAAYAFWEAFYKTTVDGDNILKNIANLEFIQSNTLVQPLTTGTGYQLYGLGWKEKDTLTIRLPKPDLQYAYYADGAPNGNSVTIPATEEERGKLAYSGEQSFTLTNTTASEYFFFGNPTMAYIDMYALYKDNNSIWSGVFKTMQNDQINAATPLTLNTYERYLPPMTSALLKVKDGATEAEKKTLSIILKPSHLTLNNTVSRDKIANKDPQAAPMRRIADDSDRPINEDAMATEMLTIYAFAKDNVARTVLATNPIANDYYTNGEDAIFISTGVENKSYVTSPLNMYTVAEQVPMMADVRQGISQVPLAILAADNARQEYMQLAFYYTANWTRTCYFVDHKTGQRIRIMDGLVIQVEMPENHEQRYSIEGPDTYQGSDGVTTSTTQPNVSTTGNRVWAYAPDRSTVIASSSDIIESARLYDLTGRLITTTQAELLSNSITLQNNGTAGVYIVDVTLRNGTTARTQVIVQ